MPRRTRTEIDAENELLLAELEAIRDCLDDLLEGSEDGQESGDDAEPRGTEG